jgi:hypothetical protein
VLSLEISIPPLTILNVPSQFRVTLSRQLSKSVSQIIAIEWEAKDIAGHAVHPFVDAPSDNGIPGQL